MACSIISVEVRGELGEHYTGVLSKVTHDELGVTFCDINNSAAKSPEVSQSLHLFPYEKVRLAASVNYPGHLPLSEPLLQTYRVGDNIEVWLSSALFSPKNEAVSTNNNSVADLNIKEHTLHAPMAWWEARITKVTKDLLGVDVVNYKVLPNAKIPEIVDRSQIRQLNDHPYLTPDTLYSRAIPIGSSLSINLESPELIDFVRHLNGMVFLDLDQKENKLTFISPDNQVIRRVTLLEGSFVRHMQSKQTLVNQTNRRNEDNQSPFTEIFSVQSDLIGMAIGQQGRNIADARSVPGVTSIFLDDETKTFYVHGKTQEAVKDAREKLEFMRDVIDVAQTYAPRIVKILQEVVDKSQVIRIWVAGDQNHKGGSCVFPNGFVVPYKPDYSFIQVVGRRSQLEDARLLIEYNIDMFRQMDEEEESTEHKDQFHKTENPPYAPFYNQPNRESSLPPMSGRGAMRGRGGYRGAYRGGGERRYGSFSGDESGPMPRTNAHERRQNAWGGDGKRGGVNYAQSARIDLDSEKTTDSVTNGLERKDRPLNSKFQNPRNGQNHNSNRNYPSHRHTPSVDGSSEGSGHGDLLKERGSNSGHVPKKQRNKKKNEQTNTNPKTRSENAPPSDHNKLSENAK